MDENLRTIAEVMEEDLRLYNVVRFYFNHGRRIIKRNLLLSEAQAFCGSPESSSKSATSAAARRTTDRMGPWFNGYEEVKSSRVRRRK